MFHCERPPIREVKRKRLERPSLVHALQLLDGHTGKYINTRCGVAMTPKKDRSMRRLTSDKRC
jgi:hypothetical protein